jgi:hypothetical protein
MSLFKPGQIVATPAAIAFCEEHQVNPLLLIGKHMGGDWGDLSKEDVAANVHAIQHDERVVSVYRMHGDKLFCITEWDRSVTTLLMLCEY